MAVQAINPSVTELREAAEMAVFRLYGFLGAGTRLIKALEGLEGIQTYVASPFRDRVGIFKVAVSKPNPGEVVHLQVTHAPSYDGVHDLSSLPADTPGYWTALLKAGSVDSPFSLAALTVEGRELDLGPSTQQYDNSAP